MLVKIKNLLQIKASNELENGSFKLDRPINDIIRLLIDNGYHIDRTQRTNYPDNTKYVMALLSNDEGDIVLSSVSKDKTNIIVSDYAEILESEDIKDIHKETSSSELKSIVKKKRNDDKLMETAFLFNHSFLKTAVKLIDDAQKVTNRRKLEKALNEVEDTLEDQEKRIDQELRLLYSSLRTKMENLYKIKNELVMDGYEVEINVAKIESIINNIQLNCKNHVENINRMTTNISKR